MQMLDREWNSFASVSFDMSEIGKGVETLEGALGDVVGFPEIDIDGRGFSWEAYGRKWNCKTVLLTASPLTLTLKLDPIRQTAELPFERGGDLEEVVVEDLDDAEDKPASEEIIEEEGQELPLVSDISEGLFEEMPEDVSYIEEDSESPSKWLFSFEDLVDACKGCLIHLPVPTPEDGTAHVPSESVDLKRNVLLPRPLLLGRARHCTSDGLPYCAMGDLIWRGEEITGILIVLTDANGIDEKKLRKIRTTKPDLPLLCVDISKYEGETRSQMDMLDLADFVLGRNEMGEPRKLGATRQWLYVSKEQKERLEKESR